MSIDTYVVFSVATVRYDIAKLIQASSDGLARGLFVVDYLHPDHVLCVRKFSIDATGGRYVGVIGDPSLLWFDRDCYQWGLTRLTVTV